VPNPKAFPEGAYEVIRARFAPGGAELLVDQAVRMLVDLKQKLKAAAPMNRNEPVWLF